VSSGHLEVQDIARQMARAKAELDRSVMSLRGWARDVARRFEEPREPGPQVPGLRSLGETVGGLAHNLNNSLAAILGHVELLLREPPSESTARRLSVIRDVALEASATVRRLQGFAPRHAHATGSVALAGVIAQAVEMTAPRWRDEAQRRGVAVSVTQRLEAVPRVEADALDLRDAVVRLILNAVAAMPEGGTLAIRAVSEESGWVALEVRDSRVVRPLAAQGAAGTGAASSRSGLDDVAELVERHGGAIDVESEPGRGVVVRLRLRASRFQIIPPSDGVAEEAVAPASAVRVLLVDDDPRQLAVVSDMLRVGGHPVTATTNGEEAIEAFDPAAHDVVITDLGMPRVSGWEVAERIKGKSPETTVFLLTGWGESVMGHESSQFVDRAIAKPVSAESLLEYLAEIKRRRPAPP
jgi:CheY-like chemotaxis protein